MPDNYKLSGSITLAIAVLIAGASLARAESPTSRPASPTSNGVAARDIGLARGTSAQQRLMARRAAEVIAARNALAAARGLGTDADGRLNRPRDGHVLLAGTVRGQRTVSTEWLPSANPPQYRVWIEVPPWGIW